MHRTRTLGLAVIAGLILSASLMQTASAAVTTPARALLAPAAGAASGLDVPPQRILGAQATQATDTCGAVQTELAKAGKRGAAGCVRPGDPQTAREWLAAGHLGTQAMLTLPQWCLDHPGSWWGNRRWACSIGTVTIQTIDLETRQVIGEANVLEMIYIYTVHNGPLWGHQIQYLLMNGWGAGLNTLSMSGTFTCYNQCSVHPNTRFPQQPVTTTAYTNGEGYADSALSADPFLSIGTGRTGWRVQRYNPAWTGQGGVGGSSMLWSPIDVRCDRVVPGVSTIGCVHSVYAPTWVVSLSGGLGEFARHVYDAQTSGLAGAYPNGTPLRRLTDPAMMQRNRDQACPESYTRPAGLSCDEYPFRSTWQGAYSGMPQGPGRTFPYCQIPQLGPGSGPAGYSACMISANQNSAAGSLLNSFYIENRIIENDQFRVYIVA